METKNKKKIAVTPQKLMETQKVLMSANFELEEIWTPDDDNEIQIWLNNENSSFIEIKVVDDEKDATRQEVVNEIIDVWYEVKSIREVFDKLLSEDDLLPVSKEETQLEKFENKVRETKLEWEENKEKMNFLYKNKIDPRVLTYLSMDDDEKARIIN